MGRGTLAAMILEPILHEYDLSCTPEAAFDVYVNRIGEWWPPNYTANAETLEAVTIEPGVGGRVYEAHRGGDAFTWGRITVWEPTRRLVYTSTLAQTRDHPSEISVRFTPNGDRCSVRFEHGGWNEGNASDRGKFSEWPVILDRFAALANGAPAS
jgi:uncharacterized protein YndB with AHSA1/START domain